MTHSNLPNGWKCCSIGEGSKIISGQHLLASDYSHDQKGIPYITGPADFLNGRISTSKYTIKPKVLCEVGDILITVKGSGTGSVAISDKVYCISRQLMAIRSLKWRGDFLFQFFKNYEKTYNYNASGLIPGISRDDIINTIILIPPLPEQQKIAEILSTWDNDIEKTEQLLTLKEAFKKGLMLQLLSGKKRFNEFEGYDWVETKIGSILKEVNRQIKWDDEKLYNLISVKRRSEGLFFRENLRGNQIKTKNLKEVKKGDFLISKMQILHGASALVTEEFDGMHISNSYISLVAKDNSKLDINFFNWLSKTPKMYNIAYLSSYGVHIEKMTFNLKDYFNHKIKTAIDIEEQRKIASVLSSAEKEIELLKKQLEALKQQKKGLMQQLLTGKIRVKT